MSLQTKYIHTVKRVLLILLKLTAFVLQEFLDLDKEKNRNMKVGPGQL